MHDVVGTQAQLTLGAALRHATADLRHAGIDGAGDDARRLLAAALALSAAQLLARPTRLLSTEEAERFSRNIARRAAREPVSRILGEREFYGRSFAIGPATLDPRPDSETLIEAALELAASEQWPARPLRILDVGTGSGCLLLTLLAELPDALGVGTDTSATALEIARANARRLGVAHRAHWLVADALEAVRGPFDILISNPPYIPTGEISRLDPEVRCWDPSSALDGGADGLRFFHRLVADMRAVVPDGLVLLEVGHDQADAVGALLAAEMPAQGAKGIRFYRDVAGLRRCVAARTRKLSICPESPWILAESALVCGKWNRPRIMLLLRLVWQQLAGTRADAKLGLLATRRPIVSTTDRPRPLMT
jgi:release factor glutamine methyltransferase